MAGAFNIDGLVSGLQSGSIIEQLMTVERQPLVALQRQAVKEQARTAAWQTIKQGVGSLQNALQALTLRVNINGKSALADTPSTTPAYVSAVANADAAIGSFTLKVKQLATSTSLTSTTAAGNGVSATAPLASAGFLTKVDTTQTAALADRFFTINGQQIVVDANDVLDDAGNASNSVLQKLRDALPGWTFGLEADTFGRSGNRLRMTAPAGVQVQIGSGADTSNFLRATNLLAAQTTTDGLGNPTIVSSLPIGGTQISEPLGVTGAGAGLQTALTNLTPTGGGGAFSINGVQINFTATDSMNGVISRINASTAGVRASWDTANDKLVLANVVTGARQVTLANVGVDEGGTTYTSNFLDAVGVMGSTATLGQNAVYSVNGAPDQMSDTNSVTNAIPGVSLNLLRSQATQADPTAGAATAVTINVNQDADAARRTLQGFVSAYNAVLDTVSRQTLYNQTTKVGAALTGDSTVRVLERQLRSLVSSPAMGVTGKYQSLADIGIGTGKVGSAVGTTNRLMIDDAKLSAALADSPQAVETMLAGFLSSAGSLTAGGNITAMKGNPTAAFEDGSYTITQKPDGVADIFFTNSYGKRFTTKNVTFVPGVDNTTAIPGMTLTLAGVLTARTDTFSVSVTNRGSITWFKAQVDGMVGADGLFQSGEDSSTSATQAITRRITAMEARVAEKQKTLNRKFAALEGALAKVQSQSAGVSATLSSLSSYN